MKTQNTSFRTNKTLGIYTLFMVSLSTSYIVTTYINHFTF